MDAAASCNSPAAVPPQDVVASPEATPSASQCEDSMPPRKRRKTSSEDSNGEGKEKRQSGSSSSASQHRRKAPASSADPPETVAAGEGDIAAEATLAVAQDAKEPAEVASAEAEPQQEAADTAAAEDPAAALGIAELERLATSLGCTQTALLQAGEIDPSVVAALPEDMRGAVVMATLSQVNVDHLRTRGAAESTSSGAAPDAGYHEIDASVLEALPPEIREEVMREEERKRREQERAQQRAAEAATAQAQAPQAAAAIGMSGDMDNASFIASLDPMLREEVLMTAPEEVLQTLPAELVAEAQLSRDRAFMRIASRREGPPPTQPPPQVRAPRPQPPAPVRPHHYLQAMEQQLSQLGGRRAWFHGTDGRFRQASDDFMAQLGLALGGSRSRQASPLAPPAGAGGSAPGLSSYDEADRALLDRLGDYDEESCQGMDPPLPPAAIRSVCQLLYLRHEVTVTPLTRLFFNLSLHPATRHFTLGQFLVLLCKEPQGQHAETPGSSEKSLPPAHLYEGLENGLLPMSNATEVKAVGAQRVLQILAYLLRRVPQCGEFFAKPLQKEPWLEGEAPLVTGGQLSSLIGHHSVNVLLRLLTTKLFLASSRHAASLLAILHALLVPVKAKKEEKLAEPSGGPAEEAPQAASEVPSEVDKDGKAKKAPDRSLERWSVINRNMHTVLSRESVLALCHFLCQAGSGHGSSGEADTFQMAGEILVALAASQEHLTMVRADLMRVLANLVTNIEADLAKCEPASTDPSTMERLLRLVRTLAEVFKEAAKASANQELKIEDFLREARLEDLWTSLDQTLDRLHDTEVFATPAQRILSTGVAPSQLRIESSTGSNMSGALASNVQTTPPKPLLNRLLPLIEAFFVLHNGSKEADLESKEKEQQKAQEQEGGSSSSCPGKQVFADLIEVTLVERSRFGQFCKRHRRPLNALIKQTPSLLNKSFSPVLKHMPHCLDFDNKRAYFRSQLRSRRMESRYETIRLRVRRSEIFMDSYHQLRNRTGEELRAKIQVQFQGEEGIDAGGVGKEWCGALAKEIFNPNYALFVQAGGKACTYHPNPMSYVTRDHLDFFHFIGRVIGKAIHDAQNLEAWFTRGFYKHMLGKKVIAADLEAFDPEYFSNLKWMLEHDITDVIELYFCAESDDFGQIKVVDLKPNGRNIPVTNENKYEYIQLMSEHKMTNSVRQQIDAFLKGLHEIVPPELLSLFDDKELELLISGLPDIDIEDLKANTEYHNYTTQSDQIQWFWKVLSEFSQEQRAWFLQFATGTSRVPVEGFKGLVGMRGPQKFCIHRAYGPDRLPSAHTCFNQLDLPDYPSEEVLRDKLLQAVHEGHEGFGFA
ncbi:UPL2 [Symbiodinium natans]|uniref:HECT-type E3 ubiquitin transferase n=1 Tax=Symbiodinium natans TaxID=878477 RepID=A0A812JB93_9DINO|nr:UPL2 [Symbiodinium natans]